MAKSGKKAAHALILAKKLVRLKRADGGETDPLMDSDYTSPPDKPNYVMSTEATKPVLTPNTFYERANSVLKERARDFGQGLSEMPGQAWEAIKYPVQALRGETSRAVDPNTGKIVDVSPSGMTGDEAAMVGAGLVSTGALPDIMAGKVTPNVMRAGAASDRAVNLAKAPRSDLGFYSHGAETAANLPQPKGTADQMISMLRNQGVKPAELENAGLITSEGAIHPDWAGKPVTREELSQHLQQSMPQVEETVLGQKREPLSYEDWVKTNYRTTYDRMMRAREENDAEAFAMLKQQLDREWNAGMGKRFSGDTKFGQYTLPGGENYREVLLKMPNPGDALNARRLEIEKIGAAATPEQRQEWADIMNRLRPDSSDVEGVQKYKNFPEFRSSHWDDPNVLAHIRMADRAGPNGEKLLHVEELQSDWGQKGKKEGFDTPEMRAKLLKELPEGYVVENAPSQGAGFPDRYFVRNEQGQLVGTGYSRESAINSTVNDLNDQIRGTTASLVPTSPYVTSTQGWTDLALKRVMKEAAEGGYDGVVFTPGAEQAKRYPGMEEKAAQGLQKFYDNFVTTRAKELARQHDKEANLGKAEIPNTANITGFHMPMTDKMRQSILSGQKAFKKGGRINPASGNATKDEKMEQFGHKVKESKEINPLIDTALMLVSRKT